MRLTRGAVVIAVVIAVAMAGACAAPQPDPGQPDAAASGIITDVTEPTLGGFGAAFGLALGPEGEVVVMFTRRADGWDDGVSPGEWGLALVYRDGMSEVLADEGDAALTGAGFPRVAISTSTVAWYAEREGDGPQAIVFWDRASKSLTNGPSRVTRGDATGMTVEPNGLGFALDGDVALMVGSDPTAAGGYSLIAATPAGDAWLPFADDGQWIGVGLDNCLSTPDDDVLWAETITREGDSVTSTIESFSLGDGKTVSRADPVVRDEARDGYYFHLPLLRCGEALLGAPRGRLALNADGHAYYAASIGDDPHLAEVLPFRDGVSVAFALSANDDWWGITNEGDDDAIPGNSTVRTTLVRRSTAEAFTLGHGALCGQAWIRGDYIMWQQPRDAVGVVSTGPALAACATHVGLLESR